MEQLVQAASEDPQALVLSSVVGLAGILAILTGLFRCLAVFVRWAGRLNWTCPSRGSKSGPRNRTPPGMEKVVGNMQVLLDAMAARLQSQFENLPTAGMHGDIAAIKWNVEGLQTDVAKMAQEVARLDTMSSRIQSMNLSMHDSNKEVTRVLHYLQESMEPSLDDNKGLLQEMTQSWTELKAALTMLSTQVMEFRKEFGEFRQAFCTPSRTSPSSMGRNLRSFVCGLRTRRPTLPS